MANWTFNPAEYEENSFSLIPAGDHRVRISDVVSKTFRTGNEGFEITLDVSGYSNKLWFYLVLDRNDTKKTNQRIGDFFNSFGIVDYDLSRFRNWIGKIGAVRVRHEEYNGNQQAKVAFCVSRKNQDKLPAWKENGGNSPAPVSDYIIDDSELPFN